MFRVRPALRIATAALLVACAQSHAAAAADTPAMLAPVRAFVLAFNAGAPYPDGAFSANSVVVDSFAPFTWSGPGAARRWYAGLTGATPRDHAAFLAQRYHFSVGAPQWLTVNGDRAYFVLPGTLTYVDGARHMTQRGRWTLAEVRRGGAWRIAANAWAIIDQQRGL